MFWLKALMLNIIALSLAAGIGTAAVSQVVYMHEIPTGRIALAPLIRGFVVSILVAAIAPRTAFGVRFLVFSGIYLLDLALSVATTAAAIELVNVYFDGDAEAARPFTYFGILIVFITGFAGYYTLRAYRTEPANPSR